MADVEPKRSWWRIVLWGVRLLAVALVAVVLWSAFVPDPAFPPLPVPNGYDDLTRAARTIQGELPLPAIARDAGLDALRGFVEPNRPALALMRVGLGKRCGVPLASTLQAQIESGVNAVNPIRKLGRLVESEGWIARKEGRKDDAIRAGLDLIRLGNESARGGLMIHYLTGCALDSMGVDFLARLRPELDAEDCRALIRALEAIDGAREPAREVLTRERTFARRRASWPVRISLALPGSPLERLLRPAETSTELSGMRKDAQVRLLIAELALHTYRLEHDGSDPRDLAELVPRELAAVPLDPFNDQPLRYRKDESGAARLYSVGPDRKDDGGTPVAQVTPNSRGDLRLESR